MQQCKESSQIVTGFTLSSMHKTLSIQFYTKAITVLGFNFYWLQNVWSVYLSNLNMPKFSMFNFSTKPI